MLFFCQVESTIGIKIKPGRKRALTGSGRVLKKGDVADLKKKVERKLEGCSVDPRVEFLQRVRTCACGFRDYVRHKFSIPTVDAFRELSLQQQKKIVRYMRTTSDFSEFDPMKDCKAGNKDEGKWEAAKRVSAQAVSLSTTTSDALGRAIAEIMSLEIDEKRMREKALQLEMQEERATVATLKRTLKAADLSVEGRKADLIKRLRTNGVRIPLEDELDVYVPVGGTIENARRVRRAWEALTKAELCAYCKFFDLDRGGTKSTLADRIHRHVRGKAPDAYYEFPIDDCDAKERLIAFASDEHEVPTIDFASSAWNLAKHIQSHFNCDIYGGFARDMLLRGKIHIGLDIDAHWPVDVTAAQLEDEVKNWCALPGNDCKFSKVTI